MLPGLDTVTAAVGHHNCCHDLRLDTNTHPGIFSPFQTRDGNKNESKDNDPKPKQERKNTDERIVFNLRQITEFVKQSSFIAVYEK